MTSPSPSFLGETFSLPIGAIADRLLDPAVPQSFTWEPEDQSGGVLCRSHRDADGMLQSVKVGFTFQDQTQVQFLDCAVTQPPFGGHRYYWLGPRCGQRREKLFLDPDPGEFRCRECSQLSYECNQRSNTRYFELVERWVRRAQKAAKKLELDPNRHVWDWPEIPAKPKHMHQSTYQKLLEEFQHARLKALKGIRQYITEIAPSDDS